MYDWERVESEASAAISLYHNPATDQHWPVTMTLSQVHLALARLNREGPEGARDALLPVFNIPNEQRIPQTTQALNRIRAQLRSRAYASHTVARDLDEAISNFSPSAGHQDISPYGPVLVDGIGWMDCRTIQRADLGGDHGLIIGQTRQAWFNPEFLNSEGIPHTEASPLMQVTGNRFTTAAQVRQIPYYDRDS